MKRLRRFFTVIFVTILLLATAGLYIRHRVHDLPPWYHPFTLDAATQRQASNDLDQDLFTTFNNSKEAQRQMQASDKAGAGAQVSIALSEDEMNSWVAKWDVEFHLKDWIRTHLHLEDPVVVLEGHQFIIAATSKEYDVVMSIHFEARLENGKLNLRLAEVMAGTQAVPKWMWSRLIQKGADAMEQALPDLRHDAAINAHGWANVAASDAAMSELALHMLRDEPGEPAIFLPESVGKGGRSLVMQVTGIDITNRVLTVQMAPMSADRREAFVLHLRGPEQGTVGMGK